MVAAKKATGSNLVAHEKPSGINVVPDTIKLYDCNGDPTKRWFIIYFEQVGRKQQRRQINLSRKVKETAKKYAEAYRIIEELKRNVVVKKQVGISLQEALQEAMDSKGDYLHNPKTLASYRHQVAWLIDYLKHIKKPELLLGSCTPVFIDTYIRTWLIRRRKLSAVSVNTYATHLRSLFSIIQRRYSHPNPLENFEKLRVDEPDLKIWPDHLIKQLSQHLRANHQPMYLAVLLIYHSFLRPVELTRLRLADFDTAKGVVYVSAKKGKSNHRKSPSLSEPARIIITELQRLYPQNYYIFSNKMLPGLHQLGPDYISKKFNKIRDRLGIPARHKLYNFKHTGNSKALTEGASIQELMLQNGHQEERTTRRYAKQLYAVANERFRFNSPEF